PDGVALEKFSDGCRSGVRLIVGRRNDPPGTTGGHTMKYMLLIASDPTTWTDDPAETAKTHAAYGAFTQSILESGEFVAGDALQGTDTATTVRVRNGKTATTDGPFVETKEVLGGYYV